MCLGCEPVSSINEETRAAPYITAESVGEVQPPHHDRAHAMRARQIGRVPRHAGNLEHPKKTALVCFAVRMTMGAAQVGQDGSEAVGGVVVASVVVARVDDGRCTLCTSASNSGPAINSMVLPSAKALASGVKSPVVTMTTAAA